MKTDLESKIRGDISSLEKKEFKLNLARHLPLIYIPASIILKSIAIHGKNPIDYVVEQGPDNIALAIGGLAVTGVGAFMKSMVDENEMRTICDNIKERENPKLVKSGAYNFCRHPCYLAQTLIGIGFTMMGPAIDTALALASYMGVTELTARAEERKNELQFGEEYKRYTKTVPRWLPTNLVSKTYNSIKQRITSRKDNP